MRSHLLHSTRRYVCISYGNGLAYVLEHRSTQQSILFQGDDAETFRNELWGLSSGRLPLSLDEVLGVLWNDYYASENAEADEVAKPSKLRRVK